MRLSLKNHANCQELTKSFNPGVYLSMDAISTCKCELTFFRIREKDLLVAEN